ncbi:MAG: hypothetical protein K6G44_12930, partial [Lentisphaeria bacterium]|nr:hypothetical protein [Lentisphaeria bacterium]
IMAETLRLEKSAWRGNPLTWQSIPGGFKTIATGHTLEYTNVPLSENAEVEAVVTIQQRLQVSYAIAAVSLYQNSANYYHLALVERPIAMGGTHHIELHQRHNNAWPTMVNLTQVSVESPDMNWKYDVPYRLKLTKQGDTVTGTVTTMDGKLCYKRVLRFKEGAETPVNFVRPALRNDLAIATYTELNGSHSGKTMDVTAAKTFPPYECDSYIKGKTTTPTGFFQVKQDVDGSWLAYDPLGRGFLALGMGSVRYNGQACERLQNKLLYKINNDKKYKSPKEWEENTRKRLTSWGFNTFYGDTSLRLKGLSRQHFLSVGTTMAALGDEFDITPYERKPCSAFPNVYHPNFKAWCEWRIADICGDDVNNPWVFGYFTDNELAWWGRGDGYTGLFDAAMKKPATHHAKIAIRELLLKKANGNLEKLNETWGLHLANSYDLLDMTSLPSATVEQQGIKFAFLEQTAELYFKTIHDAFRKIDPNHLLLGCRFAGINPSRHHPIVWKMAGKYSDVITWNSYIPVDLDDDVVYSEMSDKRLPMLTTFTSVYNEAKKPIMITEWSYPALDSGLPCTRGAGQRFFTQAERAKATDIFARTLLSLPFAIGYDYFMWVDQPPLGVSLVFPENTNYGIVNIEDEPYPLLVDVFKNIHANPLAYRKATLPQGNPMPKAKHLLQKQLDPSVGFPDKTQPPHPSFTTRFQGELFDVSNGRIRIERRPDDARLYFSLDGQPVGTYSAMLHYIGENGKPRWEEAQKLLHAFVQKDDKRLVIQLSATNNTSSYVLNYRIILPPDTPWMLMEFQSVTNTGSSPIDCKGLFLRSMPNFDNKRDICEDTTYQSVPNLWAPIKYSGWTKPDLSMTIAFATDIRDNARIRCTHNLERNTYHPDLCTLDEVVIQNGKTYAPAEPFCVLALITKGTLQDALPELVKLWK